VELKPFLFTQSGSGSKLKQAVHYKKLLVDERVAGLTW
jgi:hypothetical protein